MRKFTILALLAAFVAAGAFAADAAPVLKTVKGAVVSFTAADTAKPAPATLVVTVAGKDQSFVVIDKTAFVGKDKKAVDVATLKAGDKVSVAYAVDGKVDTAATVTLQ